MATSAGTEGRSNEDFVGAVPGAAVLLDGAGIPGAESICSHGVAWYTHRLGAAVLGRLSRDDGRDLGALLASAIEELADAHRDSCDLADPRSPQASVAVMRVRRDRLEYLVLADTFLLLDRGADGAFVVTDEREVAARRTCSAPLAGVQRGTPEYDRVYACCAQAIRARRNRPGGYWIAKDDPRAAAEAVTGSCALPDLTSATLLSNGASRIVSPYGLTDWPGVLRLLRAHGPDGLVRRVRAAEVGSQSATAPDDATVAYCTELSRINEPL